MTYAELVPLAIAGDQTAYNELYQRMEMFAKRMSAKFFKGSELGEDFIHDVRVHILLKLDKFKGESKFETWAYRVMFTQACMILRSNKNLKKHISLEEPLGDDTNATIEDLLSSPRNDYAGVDAKIDIERLLSQLGEIRPNAARLIRIKYIDGYEHQEMVAEGFTKTIGNSKSETSKGIRRIKQLMHIGREMTLVHEEGKGMLPVEVTPQYRTKPKTTKLCRCGCGEEFQPTSGAQTYIVGHSKLAQKQSEAAPKNAPEEEVDYSAKVTTIEVAKQQEAQPVEMVQLNLPVSAIDKIIALMPAQNKAKVVEQWLQEL